MSEREQDQRFCVLVLDDDREFLEATRGLIESKGHEVVAFTHPRRALDALEESPDHFDVAFLDVQMPEMNGIEVLSRARRVAPYLPIIMLTADDSAQTATAALQAGAFDYQTKPIREVSQFALSLQRAGRYGQLQRRTLALTTRLGEIDSYQTSIVGRSPAMKQVFASIDRLAAAPVNLIILGESGSGKELVARAIHDRSERTNGRFVGINCAALPETLIDSELFGHAKGAFTGAVRARAGAFAQADGGTLFLDEIGDLPLSVQGRLLRVLQEREFRRVGEDVAHPVDVRVIAATLVDLATAVQCKEFRYDLYYRLNVVTIEVPPLRERMEDLPLLVAFFLRKHGARMRRSGIKISPEAFAAMGRYDWPGNVRELENAVQRALALCVDKEIGVDVLPPEVTAASSAPAEPDAAAPKAWSSSMPLADARLAAQRQFETLYLTELMAQTEGNLSEAARRAGVDRSNFRKLLQRNDIDADRFRR